MNIAKAKGLAIVTKAHVAKHGPLVGHEFLVVALIKPFEHMEPWLIVGSVLAVSAIAIIHNWLHSS